MPFVIYGESGDPLPPRYNVYKDNELIISGTEKTSHTTEVAVEEGVDIVWIVTQTCHVIGGESLPGFKTAKCGDPSCTPVTDASATIEPDCQSATITWTTVPGAVEYKNFMDGIEPSTITTPPYNMSFDFEYGITYTWDIVAVCDDEESEKISVSATCGGQRINDFANSVGIYPNPASGVVTIKVKDFAKVEIYNTVGQLMETKTIETVDVASYNTGIYFFKIYDIYDANNNTVTKRVMVAR